MCFHQLLGRVEITAASGVQARAELALEIQTAPKDGCRFLMRQTPSKDGVFPNVGEKSRVFGIGNVGPNDAAART
jgi:hypothetical protein